MRHKLQISSLGPALFMNQRGMFKQPGCSRSIGWGRSLPNRSSASRSNMALNRLMAQPFCSRSPAVASPLATPSIPTRYTHNRRCRGCNLTARALGLAERLQGSGRLDFQEQDWDSELESDSDIGASLYRQFDALLEETLLDFEVGDRVSGEVLR
jgi:hypothetical protein